MTIGKIGKREVITASTDSSVFEVANLMKKHHVGDVVIVKNKNEPVGIITDRDIAMRVVADNINPKDMAASTVMSSELLIFKENQGIHEVLGTMCAKGVRRAPLVNEANNLVGIVSTDDLILVITDEIKNYGELLQKQLSLTGG